MPTVTLYTDADTYAVAPFASRDTNVGTTTNVLTGYDNTESGGTYKAYIRFPVNSIPSGAVVSGVTGYFTTGGNTGTLSTVYVYDAAATWGEGTLTYNNQPGLGTLLGSFNVGNGSGLKAVGLPTSIIDTWKASNRGLVLSRDGEPELQAYAFYSKENGTDIPYLSVTYNTPPNQPGVFTVPVTSASYPVSVAISTAWGAATDPDGDTVAYSLYYKLNGGGETIIASGIATNSYSWTPTTAGSYQLVVYATATGQTSPSRMSGTFTVTAAQTHQMVL